MANGIRAEYAKRAEAKNVQQDDLFGFDETFNTEMALRAKYAGDQIAKINLDLRALKIVSGKPMTPLQKCGGTRKKGSKTTFMPDKRVFEDITFQHEVVDRRLRVDFPYVAMNDIMRVVKEQQPRIEEQLFDNLCTLRLAIRESRAAELVERLRKAGGSVEEL